MEDLNDIFKEPDDGHSFVVGGCRWVHRDGISLITRVGEEDSDETVTLTVDQTPKHFNVAVTDEDLLLDKKFENNWNKLKEKIEIERAAIKASEDDGLIRVGQFRTLNSIDNFIKELED